MQKVSFLKLISRTVSQCDILAELLTNFKGYNLIFLTRNRKISEFIALKAAKALLCATFVSVTQTQI